MHPRTIAIIGAGFSGAMVAVHLLRARHAAPTTIVLLERRGISGGGLAYGTTSPRHVLNVPAGRMSAFDDDPSHFLAWVRRRDADVSGGSFVPRMLYGAYLADLLDEAGRAADPSVRLVRMPAEARAIRAADQGPSHRLVVDLGPGGTIEADHVLLAVGNLPPADPAVPGLGDLPAARYARDPWARDALDVGADQPVLLLGTGLTMLDIALALDERGHRAPIHALSRRGLLPQAHRESATAPPVLEAPPNVDRWPATARGMCRALRVEVVEASRRGVDWREVVTSIRHDTPALWQRLDQGERRRFLRRLRPYWETHRHRSAPATARAIRELVDAGRLRVAAGRIASAHEHRAGLELVVERRGGGPARLFVARMINCTGPDTDIARVDDPLMGSLRRMGHIRPDPLGLGVDSDEHGAVIDAQGRPSERIFIVGPLRKGRLWEHTAVPELRGEALAMARRLAEATSPVADPAPGGRG